jgi:tripartite-type tricarboxylate transporter receptor subunit TctC
MANTLSRVTGKTLDTITGRFTATSPPLNLATTMNNLRRLCLLALPAVLTVATAPSVLAQSWPTKPVRIVVPAPAGSSLDVIVRTLGEDLKTRWGQPLVVENKAGAGGQLGMDVVAKAAPDGYTLGIGFNGPIAFGPHMYKKMLYNPATDLVPVVLTTSQPNVLAVPASHPANTVAEFVAWAKQQGGKLSYGSVGNGSSSHLTMELLRSMAGFDATHVPFAGSPPAGLSLAAGETQALFTVQPALIPLVQGNRVKLIASTGAQRLDAAPNLATVAESGFAGFEALAWNGLFAPAGTPTAVIEKINADINASLKEASVRDTLRKQGLVLGGGSSADFKAFIEKEGRTWGAIIKKNGISID